MKHSMKRLLATVLAVVVCLSSLPTYALADTGAVTSTSVSSIEEVFSFTALPLGETVNGTIKEREFCWFSFVPDETDYYTISGSGKVGTSAMLYDDTKNDLLHEMSDAHTHNVCIVRKLNMGCVYYIRVGSVDAGAFGITVSKASTGVCGDDVTYSIDTQGVMTVRGTGAIWNYSEEQAPPFRKLSDQIKAVEIQSGVDAIGTYAFAWLKVARRVTIPKSVTHIGEGAFERWDALEDVRYAGTAANWKAMQIDGVNGWLNRRAGYTSVADSGVIGGGMTWSLSSDDMLTIRGSGEMPDYNGDTSGYFSGVIGSDSPWDVYKHTATRLVVGEGITRVGNYAFPLFDALVSVELPESLTEIGDYAFFSCKEIPSIMLPPHLTTIGVNGLSGMNRLSELTLPEGLVNIGVSAFYSDGIRRVYIPATITHITANDFGSCTGLTYVSYGGTQSQWEAVTVDSGNDPLQRALFAYADETPPVTASGQCGTGVAWALDDSGVLRISGSGAMDDYTTVKRTDLNVKYTDVDGYSLNYLCTAPWGDRVWDVKQIVVSDGVTHIGNYAFYNCYNAVSVSLPNTLKSIGKYAFRSMKVRELYLPDSVESIGAGTFYGCVRLADLRLSPNITVIPSECTRYCYSLKALELPEKLETIAYHGLLGGLEDITIPASVASVEYESFGANTVRFLGPVPDGLTPAMLLSTNVYCQPDYYMDFRDFLVPYVLGISSSAYDKNRLGTLSAGDQPITLSEKSISINENRLFAHLSASINGKTDGLETTWRSSNEKLVEVRQDGEIVPKGYSGGALVYAETTCNGYTSLAFCKVMLTNSKNSSMLLATLPTRGIKANPIADAQMAVSTNYSGVIGYEPSQYIELDKNNADYKELRALTDSLTAGCANDREKVTKILGWVRSNTTWQAPPFCMGNQVSQVYAVYHDHIGNCMGFSKLAGFMYSLAGIPSAIAASDDHMWNVVLLDGEWVMVDAQYGTGAFYADYSGASYKSLKTLTFCQGDNTYVIDTAGEIKLAGVGMLAMEDYRKDIVSVNVPDYVDTVFGYAFANCVNLEEVVIPSNVTSIGSRVFSHCKKLRSVTIPDSVENIGDHIFFEASKDVVIRCYKGSAAHLYALTNDIRYELISGKENVLTIPAACERIESEAFAGVQLADLIYIPETVIEIADDAFDGFGGILMVKAGSYAETWARQHAATYIAK